MCNLTRLVLVLFHLLAVCMAFCQEEINPISLAPPSLPAFSIIGNSIEEVSRPTEPRAVLTSLQNSLGENGFISDIGIEFNPFWFKDTVLHASDYFNFNREQSIKKNLIQTSSFSIATNSYQTEIDSSTMDGKRLGIGYRFQPLTGRISNQDKLYLERSLIRLHLASLGASLNDLLEEMPEVDDFQEYKKEFLKRLEKLNLDSVGQQYGIVKNEIENCDTLEDIKKLARDYEELSTEKFAELIETTFPNYQRTGWIVEIAAATFIDFPTNNFNMSFGRKTGVWLTVDKRSDSGKWDLIASPRLIFDHENDSRNIDLGVSTKLNYDGFNISVEAILRNEESRFPTIDFEGNNIIAVESTSSWRYTLNFQYLISKDYSVSGVFGKDWSQNARTQSRSEVLAQLGLNIQFGNRSIAIPAK